MDACLANPAASIDLHEVLYGVVTPAGPWGGFWGQGALKKLVAPISTLASLAFRNHSRDVKHSSNRSFHSAHSDPDDFSIGTCRSDSDDTCPQTITSAVPDNHRSSSAVTPSSFAEPARPEPAFTPQNLPEEKEDRTQASSSTPPAAAVSTAAEKLSAQSGTAESAASSAGLRQPSVSSARTLQSGSPNTVVQAAARVGLSSSQERPLLASAPKPASSEVAKRPGAQVSTADEATVADVGGAGSSPAGKAKPTPTSEQASFSHSHRLFALVSHPRAMLCSSPICFLPVTLTFSNGGLQPCIFAVYKL